MRHLSPNPTETPISPLRGPPHVSASDYRRSDWPGTPAETSRPGTVDILRNAVRAVLLAPSVVGLLALTGPLSALVPDLLGGPVEDVGRAVAVALAAPAEHAYDGDLPLPVRVVVSLVATLLAAIPVAVGPLLLVGPGVSVVTRLFLATPAVTLGGHGPVRALTKSWELMDGSVLATFGALVVLVVVGFGVGSPLLVVSRSEVLVGAVLSVVVAAPSVGAQVYLYVELEG